MNTNDPQAKYGEQPKREPFLSEAEVERILDKHDYRDEMDAMKELWRFYENEIASGELMVNQAPKNRLVVDGEETHVYGAHTGLYLFSFDQLGRTRVRLDMTPKFVALPKDMYSDPTK